MKTTPLIAAALACLLRLHAASVTGELREWHKITLDFSGPTASETGSPNPFTDYRLNVTFHHPASGKTYLVPGYFAADGDAANTSAASGNVWRAHFAPDEPGTWNYEASFRTGSNVATSSGSAGSSAGHFDGEAGSFSVEETNKTGRDLRAKGRLDYVGKHHLRFAGSGEYFMKAGTDSPENLLAYQDFDGDFKNDGEEDDYIKDWAPHVQDWQEGDPVWQGDKGKGLIGAVNYLASEGLNAFSFLTMNINGDDRNVFPYLDYDERERMDVSRLDQWEILFEHATRQGMYLHFKTQERENHHLLDGGDLGNQRKLYYRELIARFSHHLALNWNLGEENNSSLERKRAWAQYFHDNDPYRHHIVIHNGDNHFDLMGPTSEVTGMSLQMSLTDYSDTFTNILRYVKRSSDEGKPWVVACDEPGSSSVGLRPDDDPGNRDIEGRRDALWGTIMAGGAGIEFYFGYQYDHSDLTCNDFRSRDSFWDFCRHAVGLFNTGLVPFQDMTNRNDLISGAGDNGNRCLAKLGDSYLVQLRSGGTHSLDLSGTSGNFQIRWFDPRNGGTMITGGVVSGGGTVNLGSPPGSSGEDWIVLVSRASDGTPLNQPPDVHAGSDVTAVLDGPVVSVNLNGTASDDGLPEGSSLTVSWTQISGPAGVTFSHPNEASTSATFSATGTHVLRLTADDGEFSTSDDVTVVIEPGDGDGDGDESIEMTFGATHDAFTQNGNNNDGTILRVENSSRKRIIYLQFDVGTSGAISSAALRLTQQDDVSGGTMTLRLYAATSNDWTESTITGSNAPPKGAELDSFTGDIGNGSVITFDVSSFVTSPGAYSFVLEADPSNRDVAFAASENSLASARPELIVTTGGGDGGGVEPENTEPVVEAGPDQEAVIGTSPVTVRLNGAADDDGLPDGSTLEVSWTVVEGPAAVSFSPADSATTDATFSAAGSYVLRLEASDGELSSSDDVTVTLSPAPPPENQEPQVDAGPDRSVVIEGSEATIDLAGSASDDGNPDESTLAISWSQLAGPAEATFTDASDPETSVTFTVPGNYALRLTASDGELSASDDMAVVVEPSPSDGDGDESIETTFGATHDAFTQNGKNNDGTILRVESSSRKRIIYLQFDVGTSGSVSSAALQLTQQDDVSSGTMTLRLHAATSNDWTESTITGSNAPPKGAELDAFTGDIGSGKVITFDVSTHVTSPGTYSFILEADPSNRDVAFAASENSSESARPQLTVVGGSATIMSAATAKVATENPVAGATIQIVRSPGPRVLLGFAAQGGRTYRIQRSVDLVEWTTLDTLSAGKDGRLEFIDSRPPELRAYYRLEWDD